MEAIHWRIKKFEHFNEKVNLQTPNDADNDNNNARPPGHHHSKGRIFSLKNPSKKQTRNIAEDNLFSGLRDYVGIM